MWIRTVDGQDVFDWTGYYASKLVAHNHPRLQEPEYQNRLLYAANNKLANPDFLSQECLDYYKLVRALAPRCMRNPQLEVYAVNSGAEAVENMMKYFITLHREKFAEQTTSSNARRFIYFSEAFHGRTVFALNITRLGHDPVITKDFHGLVMGNTQIPFPAINNDMTAQHNAEVINKSLQAAEECLKQYGNEIVGIIVEPMQGAGGHRVTDAKFFQKLSALANKYNVYLGFDEVQTAGGPIGEMFMVDSLNLPYPPDAVAVAKKFGCGVIYMHHPMLDRGVLDSTWGGTLADMVRFVQEMKIVRDEKLIEQVAEKSEKLLQGLRSLQAKYPNTISNIRGMGLYQGFSLLNSTQKAQLVEDALETEDLLLLGAGPNSIRFRPHLNVTLADIDLLIEKLDRLVSRLQVT
jgi:L-lysine 6-transaminase